MARMLGRVRQPWCPICKRSPGPDCPAVGDRGKRTQRRVENRGWRADIDPWDLHVEPDEAEHLVLDQRHPAGRWHFRADPQAVTGRCVRAR